MTTLSDIRAKHAPEKLPVKYFVIRRDGQDWTPAAKAMAVYSDTGEAEAEAMRLQFQHPVATFGVAVLISETRPVAQPFMIVKA